MAGADAGGGGARNPKSVILLRPSHFLLFWRWRLTRFFSRSWEEGLAERVAANIRRLFALH
jgi:hypothetical protein